IQLGPESIDFALELFLPGYDPFHFIKYTSAFGFDKCGYGMPVIFKGMYKADGPEPGYRFYPSDSGGYSGFAQDLEETYVAGRRNVRASAKLHAYIADLYNPDAFTVFLTEESSGSA